MCVCVCVLGGVCDKYSVMCHDLCQQGVSFKNCVTVPVNRVAMPGRTEGCVCVCVCVVGRGSVTNTVSCVTVSVNRVAMPGRTEVCVCGCVCVVGWGSITMTVQCVTVSVNRVAMPGRTMTCLLYTSPSPRDA